MYLLQLAVVPSCPSSLSSSAVMSVPVVTPPTLGLGVGLTAGGIDMSVQIPAFVYLGYGIEVRSSVLYGSSPAY